MIRLNCRPAEAAHDTDEELRIEFQSYNITISERSTCVKVPVCACVLTSFLNDVVYLLHLGPRDPLIDVCAGDEPSRTMTSARHPQKTQNLDPKFNLGPPRTVIVLQPNFLRRRELDPALARGDVLERPAPAVVPHPRNVDACATATA